jgi:hypothetical protein
VIGSLVVTSSRQLGEAFFGQDGCDGRRADRLAVAGQRSADLMNGQVQLPKGNDPISQWKRQP